MFDCFMFNNELDILEVRLHTLAPHVEKFVLVESNVTHSGLPKDMSFDVNKGRFEQFLPQIIHLKYECDPLAPNSTPNFAWVRENGQRNMLLKALDTAYPADNLLYISDADEIPKPTALEEAKSICLATELPVAIDLYDCMYYMNMASDIPLRGPYIYDPRKAEAVHNLFTNDRGEHPPSDPTTFRWHMNNVGSEGDFPRVIEAGWHFSMTGGMDVIRKKLAACAHVEFNTPEFNSEEYMRGCIEQGIPYFEKLYSFGKPKIQLRRKEHSFLPVYVQDNLEKFTNYILR